MKRRGKPLEGPRAGVALFWFFPIDDREPSDPFAEIPPEEVERLEALSGIDMRDLVGRMQQLAVDFRRDPEALQAHIKRLAAGNELVAQSLTDLLRSMWEKDDEAESREAGEGVVLDFEPDADAGVDGPRGVTDDDGDDDDSP